METLSAILSLPEDAQSRIPALNRPIQIIPMVQYPQLIVRLQTKGTVLFCLIAPAVKQKRTVPFV